MSWTFTHHQKVDFFWSQPSSWMKECFCNLSVCRTVPGWTTEKPVHGYLSQAEIDIIEAISALEPPPPSWRLQSKPADWAAAPCAVLIRCFFCNLSFFSIAEASRTRQKASGDTGDTPTGTPTPKHPKTAMARMTSLSLTLSSLTSQSLLSCLNALLEPYLSSSYDQIFRLSFHPKSLCKFSFNFVQLSPGFSDGAAVNPRISAVSSCSEMASLRLMQKVWCKDATSWPQELGCSKTG